MVAFFAAALRFLVSAAFFADVAIGFSVVVRWSDERTGDHCRPIDFWNDFVLDSSGLTNSYRRSRSSSARAVRSMLLSPELPS
jgi:hypothetical protein